MAEQAGAPQLLAAAAAAALTSGGALSTTGATEPPAAAAAVAAAAPPPAVAPPSSREAEWRVPPPEETARAAASQSPTAHGAPNDGAPSRVEWPFSLLSPGAQPLKRKPAPQTPAPALTNPSQAPSSGSSRVSTRYLRLSCFSGPSLEPASLGKLHLAGWEPSWEPPYVSWGDVRDVFSSVGAEVAGTVPHVKACALSDDRLST